MNRMTSKRPEPTDGASSTEPKRVAFSLEEENLRLKEQNDKLLETIACMAASERLRIEEAVKARLEEIELQESRDEAGVAHNVAELNGRLHIAAVAASMSEAAASAAQQNNNLTATVEDQHIAHSSVTVHNLEAENARLPKKLDLVMKPIQTIKASNKVSLLHTLRIFFSFFLLCSLFSGFP